MGSIPVLRALCLALLLGVSVAQLSAPVAVDGHVSVDGNKFLQREAELDKPGAL